MTISFDWLREGFKKKCGIFQTFQNPPTPLAKCGKKHGQKIIFKQKQAFWQKIFFPIEKVLKNLDKFQDLTDLVSDQPPY